MIKYLLACCTFLWFSSTGCVGNKYPQGKRLYTYYCSNCHMEDGAGLKEMYPSISDSEYTSNLAGNLPCLIRNGRKGGILTTVEMPAIKDLTEAEMFNLVNYVLSTWGEETELTLNQVRTSIDSCIDQ